MKSNFKHWVPASYCAFISLIALASTVTAVAYPGASAWGMPAFYSFLPMCFFFVGAITTQQQKEIDSLRQELAQLRQARS